MLLLVWTTNFIMGQQCKESTFPLTCLRLIPRYWKTFTAVLHSSWFITFAGLQCSSASLILVSIYFFNPLPTTAISNLYHTPHSSSYSTFSSLSTDDFILYFRGGSGEGQIMQELDNFLFHPQTKVFVNIIYLSSTFLSLDSILF